jgi:hypothetical protein
MPTPKISYGTGGGADPYIPPNLFPEFYRLSSDRDAQRHYLIDIMEGMAKKRELLITDLLSQPSRIRDKIGRIMKNVTIDPEGRTERPCTEQLPQELAYYKVKIRCIPDRGSGTVKFKRGVVKDPRLRYVGGRVGRAGMPVRGVGTDGAYQTSIRPNVDERVDYGTKEVDLDLPEAWICMSQHGKNCRKAASLNAQNRYWLYEEVPPKRGPGRPPNRD